jgi:DNA-directed RNA polymerase, mitochondrial
MRAMFLFDEGQVLTPEGFYWLKVHLANCYGIDKVPFDERVAWVDRNYKMVMNVARYPKDDREWLKADSPYMFVAACMAIADAHEGKPVHIPVSFDGSCSGLQHLSAMMRSPEGALVNLTPSHAPQDIYQKVADVTNAKLIRETDPEQKHRAEMLLNLEGGKGVTRKLIKRLVMTYAYSSNQRGMRDQLLDDHIRSAAFKVLTGDLPENPFGEDYWMTADYLAKVTRQAIAETVSGPTRAMDFLRDISGMFSHEGKPTEWHTPMGFPVMMRYPKIITKQFKLFLSDKAIKFKPRTSVEAPGIDKRKAKNAASPNFVHSMDACHLMMVLLECKKNGLDSVALVHDSFGCLPNDAPRFRDIIRTTFRRMYEENDVLDQFRNEALEQLDVKPEKVPPVPEKGSLDLSLIEQSEYCFA